MTIIKVPSLTGTSLVNVNWAHVASYGKIKDGIADPNGHVMSIHANYAQ